MCSVTFGIETVVTVKEKTLARFWELHDFMLFAPDLELMGITSNFRIARILVKSPSLKKQFPTRKPWPWQTTAEKVEFQLLR